MRAAFRVSTVSKKLFHALHRKKGKTSDLNIAYSERLQSSGDVRNRLKPDEICG